MPAALFFNPNPHCPNFAVSDKQKRLEAKQGQISKAEFHARGAFTIKTLELFYRNGQTSGGTEPKMSGFKSTSLLLELKKHGFILKGCSQLINFHKWATDISGDRKLYNVSSVQVLT